MGRRSKTRRGSKFILIDGYVVRSPAWRALTPNDQATYFALKWRYDGSNNGRIGLGCRELAEALHSSKNTAHRSLNRLEEIGFIAKAKPSGFSTKNRTATEWRLTEYRCDVTGEVPTKDFMRWAHEKKSQSHHRYAQSHQRDSQAAKAGQNHADSPTTGTVKPDSAVSQSHERYTYNLTREGAPRISAPLPWLMLRHLPAEAATLLLAAALAEGAA